MPGTPRGDLQNSLYLFRPGYLGTLSFQGTIRPPMAQPAQPQDEKAGPRPREAGDVAGGPNQEGRAVREASQSADPETALAISEWLKTAAPPGRLNPRPPEAGPKQAGRTRRKCAESRF